jgi:pheromone a factor receptor
MGFVALEVFSLMAFLLQVPLLIWYIKIKNIPVACLAVWFAILNFNTFLSLQIWSSPNLSSWWNGDIFCDIMVRFLAGCSSGVICACGAIARNLCILMNNDGPKLNFNSFRSRIIDLLICLTLPLLIMILVILVQQRRYFVGQYVGCYLQVAPTWVFFPLVVIWPPILSVITIGYVIVTFYRFMIKRKDTKDFLRCSGSGMTLAKFIRFFAFCIIVVAVMMPLCVYQLVINVRAIGPIIQPYSWSAVHSSSWATIVKFLATGPSIAQYVDVGLAYVTFVCFGTGAELAKWYLECLDIIYVGRVVRWIGTLMQSLTNWILIKLGRAQQGFNPNSTTELPRYKRKKKPGLPAVTITTMNNPLTPISVGGSVTKFGYDGSRFREKEIVEESLYPINYGYVSGPRASPVDSWDDFHADTIEEPYLESILSGLEPVVYRKGTTV